MKMRFTFLTAATLLGWASASAVQAGDLPFNLLNGSWGGGGDLIYTSGPPDKLSCLGYYRSADGGKSLGIALRCTGQPDKIEFRSKLAYADGKLSGTWEERTNNATGNASGTISDNALRVDFGGSLEGTVSIAFSASQQSINITISTAGSELKGAKVSLNRR
ncbi:MAG: hypothetical protein J0H36_08375 [Hyphomicrobium denitrificans]|nr:hypothetical protein [Hyphomicrobium denitrificans]